MRAALFKIAVLAPLLIVMPATTSAQSVAEYLRLVSRYPNDPEGAVATLDTWTSRATIEEGIEACLRVVPEMRRSMCSDQQIVSAAMLHTDIALVHIGRANIAKSLLQHEDEFHVRMAARLLAAVASVRGLFSERWFEFMTTLHIAAGRAGDAVVIVGEGLARHPRAARLLMVRGVITEQSIFNYNNLRGEESQNDRASTIVFRTLQDAAADYRRALHIDPTLASARVRLGWTALLLRDRGAIATFSTALEGEPDARSRYLAHLFLGGIAEREKRWDDAVREYQAARAVLPAYQTACIALSHAEDARGNRAEARAIATVCAYLRDDEMDPWWGHRLGNPDIAMLEWLRAEARRQ
jgi:tetratricopeptide (TPR) repeat protein